jgi:hypothetical protein
MTANRILKVDLNIYHGVAVEKKNFPFEFQFPSHTTSRFSRWLFEIAFFGIAILNRGKGPPSMEAQ